MENIDKIKCVLIDFEQNHKTLNEAANEIISLFNFVSRTEELHSFMDFCHKIEPVWAEEFRAWIEDYETCK